MKIQNYKPKLKSFLNTFNFLVVFLTFAFLLLTLSAKVSAQETLPLMVMPARIELEVSPGEKTAVTINFFNKSSDPISGFFKIADFLVLDKKGTPVIVDNFSQSQPRFSASSWMTSTMDRATLPANERVSFQANINVPFDAHPGGRYVAIYFEPASATLQSSGNTQEAGTGVSPRIAGLIYLKVKGDINEKALVSRFFTQSFLEYGPIKVETDVLNRGDLHIRPRGIVNLTDMFNVLVDQQRFDEQNIFPDTARSFENELGSKWLIGRYKINLDLSYGEKGQALSASTYIWMFPWRVALVVVLALIIFYLLGSNLYKSLVIKETSLEDELKSEKEEIERLKQQLRKRD